jgi:hypothetical protein
MASRAELLSVAFGVEEDAVIAPLRFSRESIVSFGVLGALPIVAEPMPMCFRVALLGSPYAPPSHVSRIA